MRSAVVFLVVLMVGVGLAVPLEETFLRVRRQDSKDQSKGGVDVDVHREKGVGTVVGAKAQGNVWTSKDGNSRVDAQGEWSRVYDGPARGKPNYSGGLHFSHRF